MDIKTHTSPEMLEKYSFWWSEARLIIAALALLLGGIPPIYMILPGAYGLTAPLLKLCWIVSGLVSAYLVYAWYKGGQKVFGGKDTKDMVAFWFMVVTGINLGWAGLSGNNVGMSLASGRIVFAVAGVIYLAVAVYLWQRWTRNGKRLF